MDRKTRREFLADVGKGMLIGSVGSALAFDLGLAPVFADNDGGRLSFGTLEPLVGLMQETPPDKLQPRLVEKLKSGTDLRTLTAAGALANARTFGGQDYVGFHTIMALAPAYEMARELPESLRPLPVLKVLYRNTHRIQEFGGRKNEVLHPVEPAALEEGTGGGELLRAATRSGNYDQAEQTFAALASLIVGAYHTAGQAGLATKQPYPLAEHLEQVRGEDPKKLLEGADSAIRENDQFRACAIIQRYGELGLAARPVFDLLLRYATSEFVALHAEKYYRTGSEEFVKTRHEYRWRQLVALARVTASEYGNPAAGYQEARELLGLT